MSAVRTTCPYCGVGCGVLAREDGTVAGDPDHPANRGRLCSKGAALGDTTDLPDRLLHPTIDGRRAGWDEALDLVAARFQAAIAEHGPDAVAFYVSGQCLTEDYYVANKLMKGFIGSANIDTNSRLCMASSVAGHARAFGADLVPAVYDDLDEADLVVLVGSNLAWCHPVLHQRLLAARGRRGTRIVVVDPRRTVSCADADLHLALEPGSDVALFNGLLTALVARGAVDHAWIGAHTTGFAESLACCSTTIDDVAAITDLPAAEIEQFYDWFAATDRTVTMWSQGVNQSSAGTDKVNAIVNCHLATGRLGRPGATAFSVTGQPNAMGGREVGGLATQLAAHMRLDRAEDRDRVRRFWNSPRVAERPGLKAVELFDAVGAGRIKALWIIATNPAESMPRAELVRAAIARCPFVVVSDCWPTGTTALADIVLPAAGWGEKDGTVTNSERRISRQRAFRAAPGEARPDWWVLAQVARRMGWGAAFAWESPAAVFREHAALSAFENDGSRMFDIGALAELEDRAYDELEPVRWPLPRGASEAGGRLFGDGAFQTPDGRARFIGTGWRAVAEAVSRIHPFVLNTGRVRDQWHTMTRTGRVPRLLNHVAEPMAHLSPEDGVRLGVRDGDLVAVSSPHASITLRAVLTPDQRPGEIFTPMHWTSEYCSGGAIGRLVGGACDPLSGQPELKATPVTVQPVVAQWRGWLLHRRAAQPDSAIHWSRVPMSGGGHLFELTGTTPLTAPNTLATALLDAPEEAESLELCDPSRGVWRYATVVAGRLDACLFLAVNGRLPSRDALSGYLDSEIATEPRTALLSGGPRIVRAATGPTVCACFSIGRDTIRRSIAQNRLGNVAELGAALKAGTNCGTCIPELRQILEECGAVAV